MDSGEKYEKKIPAPGKFDKTQGGDDANATSLARLFIQQDTLIAHEPVFVVYGDMFSMSPH